MSKHYRAAEKRRNVLGGVTKARHVTLVHALTLSGWVADIVAVALPSEFDTGRRVASGSTSIDTLLNSHLVNWDWCSWSLLEDAIARHVSVTRVSHSSLREDT
jgi:hypothetical protein